MGMISAGVNKALLEQGRDPAELISSRDLKMLEAIIPMAVTSVTSQFFFW